MSTIRKIGHCGCTLIRAGHRWLIQHAACEHHKEHTFHSTAEPPEFLRAGTALPGPVTPGRTMMFSLNRDDDFAARVADDRRWHERDRSALTPEEKTTIIAALTIVCRAHPFREGLTEEKQAAIRRIIEKLK